MATTVQSYPTSYTTSGSINGTRYRNAIGKGADTSAVSGNDYASGNSSSKAYIYYDFEFDIPEVATIDSCVCQVKGHLENTSRSTAQLDIMCGSTSKATSKFTSTSAQTITLTASSMTAAEANDVQLLFTIGYYGGLVNGATMTITYSINLTKYTVTSSATGVEINPVGDTEIYEGEDYSLRIEDVEGVHVTDNGVDVTSQLIQKEETGESYEVVNVGSYGFTLNSNGYYVSENKGIDKTAAVCRVDFHVPVSATITFTYINYSEQGYDFGVFGNIDTELSNNYYSAGSSGATITDSSYKLACNTSSHNTSSQQTLTYDMTAGDHSIWVKYSKDDASADNNDTLQFKVAITLNEPFTPGTYYVYNLTNVSDDHVIVVSLGETNALYVKLNGSWSKVAKAYKKVNGSWVEQSDLTNVFQSGVNYKFGQS